MGGGTEEHDWEGRGKEGGVTGRDVTGRDVTGRDVIKKGRDKEGRDKEGRVTGRDEENGIDRREAAHDPPEIGIEFTGNRNRIARK